MSFVNPSITEEDSFIEGLSYWQFEQAEAKAKRFTCRISVKNETINYILLANMKGNSIAEFVDKEIVHY